MPWITYWAHEWSNKKSLQRREAWAFVIPWICLHNQPAGSVLSPINALHLGLCWHTRLSILWHFVTIAQHLSGCLAVQDDVHLQAAMTYKNKHTNSGGYFADQAFCLSGEQSTYMLYQSALNMDYVYASHLINEGICVNMVRTEESSICRHI